MRPLTAAFALLAAIAGPVRAQVPVLRQAQSLDPLRAASLPFDPGQACDLEPGEWTVAVSGGYFNVWRRSPALARHHVSTGAARRGLTEAEVDEIERLEPDAELHLLDLEGWRGEVAVARGLPHGLGLSLHAAWLEVGRPHWDGVAERWHRALGFPGGGRNDFVRGGSTVYVRSPRSRIARLGLFDTGLLDTTVALTAPGGGWLGARHRAVVAVEAPTGERDGLLGSGGWDAGVRWFAEWRLERGAVLAGAGWTLLDDGVVLGLRRSDPWHALAGVDLALGPRLLASLRVGYERSLLAGADAGGLSRPALWERFGLAADLGGGSWLAVELGQDSASGVSPDWSLHVTTAWRPQGKLER